MPLVRQPEVRAGVRAHARLAARGLVDLDHLGPEPGLGLPLGRPVRFPVLGPVAVDHEHPREAPFHAPAAQLLDAGEEGLVRPARRDGEAEAGVRPGGLVLRGEHPGRGRGRVSADAVAVDDQHVGPGLAGGDGDGRAGDAAADHRDVRPRHVAASPAARLRSAPVSPAEGDAFARETRARVTCVSLAPRTSIRRVSRSSVSPASGTRPSSSSR